MILFLLYECVHLPYNFQSSFCNRVMISCSIHGTGELYCTLARNLCEIHHSLWNTLKVSGLHEHRPNYRFEASKVSLERRDETACACFHLQRKLSEELTEFRPFLQYQYNWICFCLRCFGFSPILLPIRFFSSRRSFVQYVNPVNKEWFFSRHVSWTSLFNMMTINEIISELLRELKNPCWFLRHPLFLQVETLRLSPWDSPLRFSPFTADSRLRVGSWNSQFLLIILLNHLPQEI